MHNVPPPTEVTKKCRLCKQERPETSFPVIFFGNIQKMGTACIPCRRQKEDLKKQRETFFDALVDPYSRPYSMITFNKLSQLLADHFLKPKPLELDLHLAGSPAILPGAFKIEGTRTGFLVRIVTPHLKWTECMGGVNAILLAQLLLLHHLEVVGPEHQEIYDAYLKRGGKKPKNPRGWPKGKPRGPRKHKPKGGA